MDADDEYARDGSHGGGSAAVLASEFGLKRAQLSRVSLRSARSMDAPVSSKTEETEPLFAPAVSRGIPVRRASRSNWRRIVLAASLYFGLLSLMAAIALSTRMRSSEIHVPQWRSRMGQVPVRPPDLSLPLTSHTTPHEFWPNLLPSQRYITTQAFMGFSAC